MKKVALVAAVVFALMFALVAHAAADTVTYNGATNGGGKQEASSTPKIDVKVVIGPKVTLQVQTPQAAQTVDFGNIQPASGAHNASVNLTVQSNVAYDLNAVETAGAPSIMGAGMGWARSFANISNHAKPAVTAGDGFTDTLTINPDYTVSPGTYTGTVVYTAVEH